MLLTKVQISEQMRKHAEKKNGLHDLMEIMLESMMVAEASRLSSAITGSEELPSVKLKQVESSQQSTSQ